MAEEKRKNTSSALRAPAELGTSHAPRASGSPQGEGKPVRYVYWFCGDCQRKLGGLGYLLTPMGRPASWHSCGLCGKLALIVPTDLYKPRPQFRKRTGAGERDRAGKGRG